MLKFLILVISIGLGGVWCQSECSHRANCYGSRWCQSSRNQTKQNHIKPDSLSKMTCFYTNSTFKMGTDSPVFKSDGEAPARQVTLSPFCIDQTEVSNLQFWQFVKETKHKSEPQILGDSFCLKNFLSESTLEQVKHVASQVPWWVVVKNASWQAPNGLDSSLAGRWDHPVVHVTWHDALAYCSYFKKRLPTEAEWEFACRGGLEDRLYPWGNSEKPRGKHLMNIWHGRFPDENTVDDGFSATSPVNKFKQNGFNMRNMVGNVWEWVLDWWTTDFSKNPSTNPMGGSGLVAKERVKKGGSFMCTKSFCHRYRCAARSKNTPDTSAVNIGFRCAKSL